MKKQLYENAVLIPLQSNKAPAKGLEWTTYNLENKVPYSEIEKAEYTGFVCGFNGVEVIDIDNHFGNADQVFSELYDEIAYMELPVVKTMGGGYHLYFSSENLRGNSKFATKYIVENDESKHIIDEKGIHTLNLHGNYTCILKKDGDGDWVGKSTLIESRGEGGYVVSHLSPGYNLIFGDIFKIPKLTVEERGYLISLCISFNETPIVEEVKTTTELNGDRPGDLYNADSHNIEQTRSILRNAGWKSKNERNWTRPGKEMKDGISATFGKVGVNKLYVFSSNAHPFEDGKSYSMFSVKAMLEFGGDYAKCTKECINLGYGKNYSKNEYKTQSNELQIDIDAIQKNEEFDFSQGEEEKETYERYIRIGGTYYKNIFTYDKKGNPIREISKWERQTLVDDYGKGILSVVKKYDSFCNTPSHLDYQSEIGKCYNMYNRVHFKMQKGEWKTISTFLKHIFGDGFINHNEKRYSEYQMGLDYIQILWQQPTHILPILCLISEENQTGKTTFGNFLNCLFGSNFVSMGQQELKTEFNGSYATKLIAMIDESWIDYKVIDKLKQLSTEDKILLRQMHREHKPMDYFCHWILCSNRIRDFITANENDERYWVRKISRFKKYDPKFLSRLKEEIPAFLYDLQNRKLSTEDEDRQHFHKDLIRTEALQDVIKQSKDPIIKDFIEVMLSTMEEKGLFITEATPSDIKKYIFDRRNDIHVSKIIDILSNVMKLKPQSPPKRYRFLGHSDDKVGRFYSINIEDLKTHAGITYNLEESDKPQVFDSYEEQIDILNVDTLPF